MFEYLYNVILSGMALGMCAYMILPLLRRAPKKLDPLKEYDFRPLEVKVDEYVRLTRASNVERSKRITNERLDVKVWDQKFDQFLHNDDPEKKHPPVIAQCETAHRKSEVCRNCEDDAVIKTWDDTVIRYYRRR